MFGGRLHLVPSRPTSAQPPLVTASNGAFLRSHGEQAPVHRTWDGLLQSPSSERFPQPQSLMEIALRYVPFTLALATEVEMMMSMSMR